MKKIIILTLVSIALAFTFSACTTYEEGPSFSILTPEMRIKGAWSQTAFYVNDDLQAEDYKVEFTFASDGTGTRTTIYQTLSINVTDDIEWQFNDDKTVLMTKEPEDTEWDETQILRLTNSEMWIVSDASILGMWEFRYEKL
jgi:hypothetical protein